ncbi:MAG: glycosyltransferase [Nitrospira sp.]|jgi:glycosyltransferase involved in cell wall biosynthesis|nr:glycosyltransferase [Nitrospira sp.]
MQDAGRPKILVLSRNYPNDVLDGLGLWVKRLVHQCAAQCDFSVISPVPYVPPLPVPEYYHRFRKIPKMSDSDSNMSVFHPRFLVGPGMLFQCTEAAMYYLAIKSQVAKLREAFPFDLIHAHFTYPDGVVAALLGRRYGVPVVITEHALWRPHRMENSRLVRRQAIWAVQNSTFHIAVSRSVKASIEYFTGTSEHIKTIPVGVDGAMFRPSSNSRPNPNQILYVGFLNHNKGVDVLLRAMSHLLKVNPQAQLVLVGGSFYRNTNRQERQLRQLAKELALDGCVKFVGYKTSHEVARYMRESAVLVLPSRGESFGAVLVEALACGTPVIATRCGGPEDVVTDDVGMLVSPEDEHELSRAMETMLCRRDQFKPERLRAYAMERFSWERVAAQTVELYGEALGSATQLQGAAFNGRRASVSC